MPRGTPTRIRRMAEALVEAGHEVHIATYHLGEDFAEKPPFSVHRIADVPGYRKTEAGPDYRKLFILDPLLAATVSRIVADYRIEIVHAHHFEGLATSYLTARRHRIPLIYDAHTTLASELHYYSLGLPDPIKRGAARLLDRRIPRAADHVVAVSEEIRASLLKSGEVTDERISVIPNGVETDHFTRARVGEREATPRDIIYAGSLAPYHRIDLLLRSFRRVLDKRPQTRLLVATADEFAPYESQAASLGLREHIDVLATDFETLPRRLASAAVAVNPRVEGDGLPQKLLNYMAASLPVVSFAGSARHMVHGEQGSVIANGDIEAFADAILFYLDDNTSATRHGDQGRQLVVEQFSWSRVARQLGDLYERLAPPTSTPLPIEPKRIDIQTSAIVINYNGGERIANTVRALFGLATPPARILVVDNASTDGSPDRLRAEFPSVEILPMPDNLGLPAARNAGLQHIPPGPALLLDGDVYVTEGCIEALRGALLETGAAVACPRIIYYPECDSIQCDGAQAHFIGTMSLRHPDLLLASRTAFELQPDIAEVSACIGACMMVDRDTVLAAGGFDERFYFYFEDLEFSLRMRALGHRIVCTPEAVVHHDRGAGTPGLSFRGRGPYPGRRAYLTMRHRLLIIFTHYPASALILLSPALLLYELASLTLALKNLWLREWAQAWAWQFTHARAILRGRSAMRSKRRVSAAKLLRGGPLPIATGVIGGRVQTVAVGMLSRLLNLNWLLVRRWIG
ncbi:MAG: glycosyltransferase [Sphingomonadaceae bacterium]